MFEINGEIWKIAKVSPNHPKLARSRGGSTIGSCDDVTKTIYLSNTLDRSPALLRKVLCHEIVHAAMFSYNVDLTIDQEELVADLISTYGDEIIEITNRVFNHLVSFT